MSRRHCDSQRMTPIADSKYGSHVFHQFVEGISWLQICMVLQMGRKTLINVRLKLVLVNFTLHPLNGTHLPLAIGHSITFQNWFIRKMAHSFIDIIPIVNNPGDGKHTLNFLCWWRIWCDCKWLRTFRWWLSVDDNRKPIFGFKYAFFFWSNESLRFLVANKSNFACENSNNPR